MPYSEKDCLNRSLSHVYIEEEAAEHPLTAEILSKLEGVSVIPVRHYKDLFCRGNQDFAAQKSSRQLIIARKKPPFIYKGSNMCDPFGHSDFYYCINAMNCLYDCEYCYLRGAYPSANLVIFVNLEDVFAGVDALMEKGPVYLCNSYETDLPAIEGLTGFVKRWINFAASRDDLTLEIRTKSASFSYSEGIEPSGNIIMAWSVSPEATAVRHERSAPPPLSRVRAMRKAMDRGWKTRLCIDPVIYSADWRAEYRELAHMIGKEIDTAKLYDISVGAFRVPSAYLRKMRNVDPDSVVAAFPFETTGRKGVCKYPDELETEMITYVRECINGNIR